MKIVAIIVLSALSCTVHATIADYRQYPACFHACYSRAFLGGEPRLERTEDFPSSTDCVTLNKVVNAGRCCTSEEAEASDISFKVGFTEIEAKTNRNYPKPGHVFYCGDALSVLLNECDLYFEINGASDAEESEPVDQYPLRAKQVLSTFELSIAYAENVLSKMACEQTSLLLKAMRAYPADFLPSRVDKVDKANAMTCSPPSTCPEKCSRALPYTMLNCKPGLNMGSWTPYVSDESFLNDMKVKLIGTNAESCADSLIGGASYLPAPEEDDESVSIGGVLGIGFFVLVFLVLILKAVYTKIVDKVKEEVVEKV